MEYSAGSRGSCRIRPAWIDRQFGPAPQVKSQIFAMGSGIGAGDSGCADGPATLFNAGLIERLKDDGVTSRWEDIVPRVDSGPSASQLVAKHCRSLADAVQDSVETGYFFTVLGGDHSCAIGSWSGAARGLAKSGDLGLIWVDAHMDSHTPKTSPSGYLHGMPLAHLLGYGDGDLTSLAGPRPALRPQNLCVLGVRSYEPAEYDLLMGLGVRVIFMAEIGQTGFEKSFAEALEIAASDTAGFGISIDLDGVDPKDAPGVGSPVKGGIRGLDLIAALGQIGPAQNLLGLEIAEFNPHRDRQGQTAELIFHLLSRILPKGDPL